MNEFISEKNIKTAAVIALAIILVQSLTATQSTLVQGVATVAAVAIALPLAAKLG